MSIADRVQDTSTTTGTGNFTLSGTPPTGYQALAAIITSPFPYCIDGGAEWEVGEGTVTGANTFSRSPTASSNSGSLVNFSAGTKSVFCTMSASRLSRMMAASTASFSTAIPLTEPGAVYMPQQTVSSVLAFSIAAGAVQGALCYVRLIADGTNAPTFEDFLEWGGSLGYDNREGIVNEVWFYYDGYDYWHSISQAIGATPVDATAPTASSALVANATPTIVNITMSESMDTGFVPAASAFTVGGHTVSSVAISGSSINLTCSAAFVNGEAARTVAYTQPGTNNARDLAGNLLANFSGLSITNNVGVAATGVTMTGPTTGAVSVASSNFTIGVTPGGSNITGTVVVTPSDGGGGGTFTPTTVSLTNGSPTATFTYTPSATPGARTISVTNDGGLTNPSNITYTSTSSSVFRFVSLSGMTESGTSPDYTYTSTSSSFSGCSGVGNLHRAASTDGSLAMTHPVTGANNATLLGLKTTATTGQSYTDTKYAFYAAEDGSFYRHITNGGSVTDSSVTIAANDIMRLRVSSTSVVAEVARTATPTTFIEVHTWTGDDGSALYFLLQLVNGGSVTNYVNGCTAVDLV